MTGCSLCSVSDKQWTQWWESNVSIMWRCNKAMTVTAAGIWSGQRPEQRHRYYLPFTWGSAAGESSPRPCSETRATMASNGFLFYIEMAEWRVLWPHRAMFGWSNAASCSFITAAAASSCATFTLRRQKAQQAASWMISLLSHFIWVVCFQHFCFCPKHCVSMDN